MSAASLDRLAERRRAAGPGRALVCATLSGTLADQACERDAAQVAGAGLVEHRFDMSGGQAAPGPGFFAADVPTLATWRPAWEGGRFEGGEEERRRVVEATLAAGATLVDVEMAAPWRAGLLRRLGREAQSRVVLSCHDFTAVPGDLETRVRAMLAEPVAFVKYAVHVSSMRDLLALEGLARRLDDPRVLLVPMGRGGVAGRILAHRLGAAWTYGGDAVAPGQLPWRRLLAEFRVPSLSRQSRVRALAGRPIGHSLSPAMHNAALAARGEDAVYVPCEVETFDEFLAWAEAWGIEAASVTVPFKRDAAAVARPADDLVALLGAANTLRRTGDGWEALNTDVDGFLAPLAPLELSGTRATVAGAGGAAAAAALGLLRRGATVTIAARGGQRAAELAARLGASAGAWPAPAGSWDLLVNATPVGTWPAIDATPVEAAQLAGGRLVYDLVYRPSPTRLLRDARDIGCATIGGLPMLVAQAERQFAWWSGTPPRAGVMQAAAERALAEDRQS